MDTFSLHQKMLAELGTPITERTRILDWGCGKGAYVASARARGFDVVGCDFNAIGAHLSPIETPYRLPYKDGAFDLIVSSGVLEHCRDYATSIRELARVTKPGGAMLHFFPPKWALFEHHVYVPLAGAIQSTAWLALWAALGVRNCHQRGLGIRATVADNRQFLSKQTNYLPRRSIEQEFAAFFSPRFCEDTFIRHAEGAKWRLVKPLPFISSVYGAVHGCMLFGRRLGLSRAAGRADDDPT